MNAALYVPVMRVLDGEMEGARHASTDTQRRTTPLFEIIKPGRNSARTEQYLGSAADLIVDTWRQRGPAFVELYDPPPLDTSWWSFDHPLVLLHDSLRQRGVHAIPVIPTDRFRTDDYREAFIQASSKSRVGFALRLYKEDIEVPEIVVEIVRALTREVGCLPEESDLIIDLQRILLDRLPDLRSLVLDFLAALDVHHRFRSITIGGSSVPLDLDGVPHNDQREVPRLELRLWREICAARGRSSSVGLCDYGTVRPEYVDRQANFAHINAKILYTLDDSTLVVRGQSRQLESLEDQYTKLARRLITHGGFRGPEFSWGDAYVQSCVGWPIAPGSPTTWISITTSHHLALVSAQVEQELTLRA